MTRLIEASAIVFLGYRFPPTDSDARQQIPSAIQSNTAAAWYFHTVPGPVVSSERMTWQFQEWSAYW